MAFQTLPSGLQYDDTTPGTGATAQSGAQVKVHYTGWLWKDGATGAKFDSSKDRGHPFSFALGAGQVIRGWDEGVAGMQVGGPTFAAVGRKQIHQHGVVEAELTKQHV